MAQVTFILFTSGFCQRLGFPPDIEVAEVQRSRRLGLRRVSAWSVVSRKTLAIGAEKEEPGNMGAVVWEARRHGGGVE